METSFLNNSPRACIRFNHGNQSGMNHWIPSNLPVLNGRRASQVTGSTWAEIGYWIEGPFIGALRALHLYGAPPQVEAQVCPGPLEKLAGPLAGNTHFQGDL